MKEEVFYELTHKGRSAGFFKTKEAAERCADEFSAEIEGGLYPVEIITRRFLDYQYPEGEGEGEEGFNWDAWDNGAV
jgi:hypothetical protein